MMFGLAILAFAGLESLPAQTIPIPNESFELPSTPFADPRVDSWQKSPQPVWYTAEHPWDQLTGVFLNPEPGNASHKENIHGAQALFLFALPEVALFQDYSSTDWSNSTPSHAFSPTFEVGRGYRLTAGFIGGGGGMLEGASVQLALYYRDASSNKVVVAATNIVYSATLFNNTTNFVDFQVEAPTVKPSDPWAGQHIGVELMSTARPDLVGGYWEVDNVRLIALGGPALTSPSWSNGEFRLTVQSDPGLQFEIQGAADLGLPSTQWTSLGTVTNVTGTVSFTSPATGDRRFYRARQVP